LWQAIDETSHPAILSTLHGAFRGFGGLIHVAVYGWKNWRKVTPLLADKCGCLVVSMRMRKGDLNIPLTETGYVTATTDQSDF
jgi:hypothetical protein